ncbi:hypothetical protein APHAL10511_001210 [Amanita phalloides]|nr:hypothetical protein APHAL10511_001210 [Amanita phalloides]
MSRLTTAQVISSGHYLEPSFDPASLTVSQLLGVLGYHNIKYPTPYSKPKLIQLFNEEIKTRSSKFKKERLRKENSIASDEGIKDGLTGQPLAATRRELPVRRSSRRLSQAPNQDSEISPVRQESPKRRRASAQPGLAGHSKAAPKLRHAVAEESESEEILEKPDEAGSESYWVKQPYADDSGWEDNNIFQSGAEDSSPARPSPGKINAARKNSSARRSRKSSSAPPYVLPVSSPTSNLRNMATVKFPQSQLNPDLHLPTNYQIPAFHKIEQPEYAFTSHHIDSEEENNLLIDSERTRNSPKQEHVLPGPRKRTDVPHELPGPGPKPLQEYISDIPISDKHGPHVSRRSRNTALQLCSFIIFRFFILVLLVGASVITLKQKAASASIGYCERGRHSNAYLDGFRAQSNLCNFQDFKLQGSLWSLTNNSIGDSGECSLSSMLHLSNPKDCTPCPNHAACSQYAVVCDTGYVLRPHPLLAFLPAIPSSRNVSWTLSSPDIIWKALSIVFDGFPGLGSVALPPRCLEDPRRKRNIGALGKAIEAVLGQERGLRLCASGKFSGMFVRSEEGGDAKKWGLEMEHLRETMRKKTSPHLLASFDDTFNEAIQQLLRWGNVLIGEDREGKRYLAHGTPQLTLVCTLIVKSREVWEQWRTTVLGFLLMILFGLIGRARWAKKRTEAKRVAELVQIALNSLRNQETAHHTDPITAPQPFLSSLQLRDLVLQDEHSIPVRKRLWEQVEHVVEENANVRVNLQEVQGGDEMRVWRWVGSGPRKTGPSGDA